MTPEESIAWHPTHPGGSTDILPFYAQVAPTLPKGGTFVEIGSFFGPSLSFMGTLRPDLQLWAVDPWEDGFVDAGEVLPVGPDLELCREHGGLFPAFLATMQRHAPEVLARTRVVRAPSTIGMRVIDRADMVFIDGDHALGAVRKDITEAVRVVVPGGIIAGHDYCWGNAVTRAVKEAFPLHQLADWPVAREGWDAGHSSVWWTRRDPALEIITRAEIASPSTAASAPRLPRVTVLSTGFRAPTARICRASVAAQRGVQVEHRYVEASEQSPPRTKIREPPRSSGRSRPRDHRGPRRRRRLAGTPSCSGHHCGSSRAGGVGHLWPVHEHPRGERFCEGLRDLRLPESSVVCHPPEDVSSRTDATHQARRPEVRGQVDSIAATIPRS